MGTGLISCYDGYIGEYNGVKKSDLYGTPHWWPIDQEEGLEDTASGRREHYLSTERVNGAVRNGHRGDSGHVSSEIMTENIAQKPSKALAFTINFDETESTGGAVSMPPERKRVTSLPRPKLNSVQSTSAPPTPMINQAVEFVATEEINLAISETPETSGACDVKSDNGTYTLDDDDSSHVERRSTDIPVTEIDNNEWIQKWATEASAHVPGKIQHSHRHEHSENCEVIVKMLEFYIDMNSIPPYDDTFKILDETRNIVNAIQNRVSSEVPRKPNTPGPKQGETTTSIKLNRAFRLVK